jgi:YVTN family beta-propeller protein
VQVLPPAGQPPVITLRKTLQTPGGRLQHLGHSGSGRFFALHPAPGSISAYDRNFNPIGSISARIRFSDFNLTGFSGLHEGSPAEIGFSADGKTAWLSAFAISGNGFEKPPVEACAEGIYDPGYIFRINTLSLRIEQAIRVGSGPRALAAAPDGSLVLVSNWCSNDLSIIDTELNAEVHRLPLDGKPRGIAIDGRSRYAFIALADQDRIARLKLSDYSISWITGIGGRGAHQLCLDASGRFLYASLPKEGKLVKIDLTTDKAVRSLAAGREPRAIALSPDGEWLYALQYRDHTLLKIKASTFESVQTVHTGEYPLALALDGETQTVWVAHQAGSIQVYEDPALLPQRAAGAPPLDMAYAPPVREAASGSGLPYKPESSPQGLPRTRSMPAPEPEPAAASQAGFYIIVGSYTHAVQANALAETLRKQGYRPKVIQGRDGYRVSCWQFSKRETAFDKLPEIRQAYPDAWILQQ